MSRASKGRNISGMLLLDKPQGLTSNAALQKVKRLFGARKAGHTGSLDPLASGLLPICLGEATKVSSFLLNADKSYRTEFTLGVRTRTGDAEGEVIATRPVQGITATQIEAVLPRFRGAIEQIPPMHSAIKHQGQPLYKLAHQGLEIERQPRPVFIYDLTLCGFTGSRMDVDVTCSKGTYIRTLADDIGEALGCGAHVSTLRRTRVGSLAVDQALTLEALETILAAQGLDGLDTRLLALDDAVAHWPNVSLSSDAAYYLQKGQPVLVPRAPTEGWVRLYGHEGRFIGVGEVLDDGRVAPRRLVKVA